MSVLNKRRRFGFQLGTYLGSQQRPICEHESPLVNMLKVVGTGAYLGFLEIEIAGIAPFSCVRVTGNRVHI